MEVSDLVKKTQDGDTAAFAEIYELFAGKIFRFIRLKINDQQQAEDILQEIFIKAWRNIPKLSVQGLNFNAWLYKIASNSVNDYFRKYYRTPEILELDESLGVKASGLADDSIKLESDLLQIKRALGKLPPQYRQVLELRFMEDFTLSETAQILGKTNLAVRLLQHRALKQLRHNLHKEND